MDAIDRSLITDIILAGLEPASGDTREWEVGDQEKPPAGGWTGDPNHSDWMPYIILNPGRAQRIQGTFGSSNDQVWFPYFTTAVTRSRRAAEKMSHAIQERMDAIDPSTLSDGRSMGKVLLTAPGDVERLPMEPPLFLVTDQFTTHTSKRC